MISHKYKVIFIHIPKCAGSSIERFFEPTRQKWDITNRELLYGWDPLLQIHLQHAKASTLLEKRLIDKGVWNEYFKFAFVRNPWDRAMSDYHWMMKDRKIEGSFIDYLLKRGAFAPFTSMPGKKDYRGDHLFGQHEFIYNRKGELMVDFVGRFERLHEDFKEVCAKIDVPYQELPHLKKATAKRQHYTELYTAYEKDLVAQLYHKDIALFNYQFEG